MDLSELKKSLLLDDVRVPPGGEELGHLEGKNVAVDIIQKHKRSSREESQLLVMVLEAVLETLREASMKPSPTALFASLLSFLGQHEGNSNSAVLTATLTAMSIITTRVPSSVLKSKSIECMGCMLRVIENDGNGDLLGKAAIPCMANVISASGPNDWAAMSPGYMYVLSKLTVDDPKIRKIAQDALVDILSSYKNVGGAGAQQAIKAFLELSERILSGPEKTAHEAARASNRERRNAEDNIRAAVSNALNLLSTLRQIIHVLPEGAVQQVCSQILSLYHLRQTLLTGASTDVLLFLCNTTTENISAKSLEDILKALLSINALWGTNDAMLEMSVIKLMESLVLGIQRQNGKSDYFAAKVLHLLVPQLASHAEGVARATSEAMTGIIRNAVNEEIILAALSGQGKKKSPIVSMISAVESSFGAQYFASWELCLTVAQELISRLGRNGSVLAAGLIQRIGQLCAGVDDVMAASDEIEVSRITEIAQSTLGVCIRSLGPDVVLENLPLDIEEALDGKAEGRTWLIPLLKLHMRGGEVSFWLTDIYPLIQSIESRRIAMEPSARQYGTLYALELQLWSTLPSFVNWAKDIPQSFSALSKAIGPCFQERHDIRLCVSQSIQIICSQTRTILIHQESQDVAPDPCVKENLEDFDDDLDDDSFDNHQYLLQYTDLEGQRRNQVLNDESKNWIPMLLNAFIEASNVTKNSIQGAISSYVCLCTNTLVNTIFKSAVSRVIKVAHQLKTGELGKDAVLDGGDTDTERYCTYLEAIYALLGGLDLKGLSVIYQMTSTGIKEKEPSLQKKNYKILHYIIESRPDFYSSKCEAIIELMIDGGSTAMSASRGYRIKCLKSLILYLLVDDHDKVDLQLIPSISGESLEYSNLSGTDTVKVIMTPMISEIVLSIKESNKKTRASAYDLLIEVANAMEERNPVDGVTSLVHLILGGLVGSTSQMVSATVMALARILFEFPAHMICLMDELLPLILMLLRSKSREVSKAILGFLKILLMKLDSDTLTRYAPQIIEGIFTVADDSRNKFRLRVRVILERLAKKVGFEVLEKHVPESHKSLLVHIRKQMNRKDRLKHAKSEIDWDEQSFATSVFSKSGKSAATSLRSKGWKNDLLSEDSQGKFARQAKTDYSSRSQMRPKTNALGSEDTFNLLDASTSRRMVGMNVRRSGHMERERQEEDTIVFAQDDQGKLIIAEENKDAKKRGRDEFLDGFDSDDSDIEDIKSIHGASLALKGSTSVARASSYAGTIRSSGNVGGKRKKNERGSNHSGDRFKAKSKGTGGDVKGKSAIEPYAYWPLDRKMLNRRQQKTRSAKQGLDKVVNAAKEGALKGRKAKRRKS